ncbi:MAG TPA: tetratricopeptide repeat protein [Polyangiaceae bacterium]|nr:tetratricopeptide repeat protein [Polyangiaceae bacterium]
MSSGAESKAGDWLRKATSAQTSGARAKYATRGLATAGDDRTLRAMLLRQLYLSQMESERFAEASETARAAVELGVLTDVACQDLARAYLGLGRHREAIEELRRASRVGPASRRAFHLWTLGSVLYFREDYTAAAAAFERAARWGTTARPLYRAQLLLARLSAGRRLTPRTSGALSEARQALEAAPCGGGYGRYVLGELAHRQGDGAAARRYLEEFVARADGGRVALRVGLSSELARARSLLSKLELEESAKV